MKTKDIRIRDPFIYAENGKYYMYGTEKQEKLCFKVYESEDLENWSEGKTIFEKTEDFWAEKWYWAPELHKYCGKYYLFASFEGACTQILIGDAPDGEFTSYADPPTRTELKWQCIDGTLYVDKNGIPYIVVSHNEDVFHNEKWHISESSIEALRLTKDLKKSVGEPIPLLYGSEFEKSVSRRGNNNIWHVTEGPFMQRTEENLYMLWSGFNKDSNGAYNYFQAVAKSDNGEIDGNWIFQDELLYDNDGGHGMVFRDFGGNLKLVIHTPNSKAGEEHPLIFDIEEKDGKLLLKEE
ncbi:MAG: glycoside hydrolase [Ruminococcaceae bacterium]|nr:glycoside hydrolase [Oscillospiraceae bacterium]